MEGYLGHWPAREAAMAAAHHPDVQVPPDEGTWFQRTVRQGHHVAGDRMGGCSVLWPPAAPHPSSGPGHLTLQGLLGTGPAPKRCSAVCVCVCVRACVSLVDTLMRVDTGSQVTIHWAHVGAASAQGEDWSSPPNVRKRRSAWGPGECRSGPTLDSGSADLSIPGVRSQRPSLPRR